RSELCPGSDVDVLLLFSGKAPEEVEELSAFLFHPLWDLGLDQGHGVRSIGDCISLAKDDFQVLASLLDVRFVAGDARVVERFREVFARKVAAPLRGAFSRWLRDTNRTREQEFGDSSGLLEPDLKNGIGGLRGVHQIGWCSALLGARGGWDDPLTRHEREVFDADYRFVLDARTALHLAAGRRMDTLHFDLQPRVAELLGYAPRKADPRERALAVERFLSALHEAMARIKILRSAFWQECFPPRFWLTKRPGPGILDTSRGLDFDPRFLDGPERRAGMGLVMELFRQAAETGRPLSLAAMRSVRGAMERGSAHPGADRGGADPAMHSESVDPNADHIAEHIADQAADPAALLSGLLGVARAPHGLFAVRMMQEAGLLGLILPRFRKVEHLVQFDDYHLHPVGRHTVETVGKAAALLGGEDERFAPIAARLEHPERVLLAALFHDLGKGGGEHSAKGADLVEETLGRYGLDKATVADVAFLVREHLLLPKTATRKDLADERVVAEVAECAETPARLDMLYLLSVADSMATGPRAWSAWTASLLFELYRKASKLLSIGPLSAPDAALAARAARQSALALARQEMDEATARAGLARMPSRAFQALPPEELVRHLLLARRLADALAEDAVRSPGRVKGVGVCVLDARPTGVGDAWELTIATTDRPGLFATLAGVLALHQLDILAAELFTWKDGTVVDVFTVHGPADESYAGELFERVRRAVRYALTGKLSLGYRLEEMRRSPLRQGRGGPLLPPFVRVDNQSSDFYTLVEVAAPDRLGLLFDVARAMADMHLSIHLAKITTDAGRIADVFHVRASDGRKLDDPGLVSQVETEIMKVLERE
ncbi:MAG: ACT domain-containing protein, partial [Desulfovibrionaceae bacterium]